MKVAQITSGFTKDRNDHAACEPERYESKKMKKHLSRINIAILLVAGLILLFASTLQRLRFAGVIVNNPDVDTFLVITDIICAIIIVIYVAKLVKEYSDDDIERKNNTSSNGDNEEL